MAVLFTAKRVLISILFRLVIAGLYVVVSKYLIAAGINGIAFKAHILDIIISKDVIDLISDLNRFIIIDIPVKNEPDALSVMTDLTIIFFL